MRKAPRWLDLHVCSALQRRGNTACSAPACLLHARMPPCGSRSATVQALCGAAACVTCSHCCHTCHCGRPPTAAVPATAAATFTTGRRIWHDTSGGKAERAQSRGMPDWRERVGRELASCARGGRIHKPWTASLAAPLPASPLRPPPATLQPPALQLQEQEQQQQPEQQQQDQQQSEQL